MRILIAGGGTAGHVYPNIAVVQAMVAAEDSEMNGPSEFLYLGCRGEVEEDLASRFGIPFQAIKAGGLRGKAPWTVVWNGVKLVIGAVQAGLAVGRFRPDAILVSGGYGSVPVVWAGRVRRVPILIYLPDIVPGEAVRRLARWASRVAVSFAETLPEFAPGRAVATGYPVRREFTEVNKAEARAALELDDDSPVVGRSRGV